MLSLVSPLVASPCLLCCSACLLAHSISPSFFPHSGKVYQKIMEIESRLLPCGLHTVGVPPTAEEAIATLVNIASLDRPEDKIKGLPRIIAESVGRDINDIYRGANAGNVSLSHLFSGWMMMRM